MSSLALKLVEGTKADRDQYINRVDVLDKVKELVMLPNEKYVTTNDLVNYYGVNVQTIRNMKSRHNEEFTSDGVLTIKGQELKKYKERIQSTHSVLIKGNAHLTLYTRRSVLRMGMLLTESLVALKIQDYLLNVEEHATQLQKQTALKFNGEWTKEIDQYIVDSMKQTIRDGKRVSYAMKEIAEEIGTTANVVHIRWYNGNKQLKPLRDRLDKETKDAVSKQLHLKLVPTQVIPDTPVLENKHNDTNEILNTMSEAFKKQQEILLEVVSELHTVKETNEKLYKGIGSLWRGYKELSESHTELKNDLKSIQNELSEYKEFINKTYVTKVNDLEKKVDLQKNKLESSKKELQKTKLFIADNLITKQELEPKNQSFKMDRNGNLTKI